MQARVLLVALAALAASVPTAAAEGQVSCFETAPTVTHCERGPLLLGENIAGAATLFLYVGMVHIHLQGPNGSMAWDCTPGPNGIGACHGPLTEGYLNPGDLAHMTCDAVPWAPLLGIAAGPVGQWGCSVTTA